ncbi:MAG: septal ring lytic transglycosylase RlpA family protein [Gammaproteobacteria bacterium]|nr:septal ring lytic transglycosylase RlpA family protein [Gammaproteobacteria bacterium]
MNRVAPLRLLAGALIVSLLGACSTLSGTGDGPPAHPVDVADIPNAVPKVEPLSPYGNPPSYVVNGKRYYVMNGSKGYVATGVASWYGTKFNGQRTSSGEVYNMYGMTAAHKTLPLPTFVQVTNLHNGRSVIVKVNDRGPFEHNRLIDLSYAAAAKLGILKHGTGLVTVRAIDPRAWSPDAALARQPVSNPAPAANNDDAGGPYLQVGAYTRRANAERMRARLQRAHVSPVVISPVQDHAMTLYRVRIGPLAGAREADRIGGTLRRLGITYTRVAAE